MSVHLGRGMPPLLAMGAVLTALGLLLVALDVARRRHAVAPETSRKLFHIGGGVMALTFPWLSNSPWPVVALGLITLAVMAALKRVEGLRHGIGGVLHSVDRATRGDLYFPLAIALLFILSRGHALLYVIPVLILTLADPAAALVGTRYGWHRYGLGGSAKSVEGSLSFFVVAVASVGLPLLLTTGAGMATLVIAVAVGALAMLAEALAGRGLDNLLVPLASYLLLRTLL